VDWEIIFTFYPHLNERERWVTLLVRFFTSSWMRKPTGGICIIIHVRVEICDRSPLFPTGRREISKRGGKAVALASHGVPRNSGQPPVSGIQEV
jgi:hypothetical protein